MAFARAVTFDGVSKDRIEELKRELSEGERPEGLPATEILLLHDADSEKSLVILFSTQRTTTRAATKRSTQCPPATPRASARP
jgi:hypothetical protein